MPFAAFRLPKNSGLLHVQAKYVVKFVLNETSAVNAKL